MRDRVFVTRMVGRGAEATALSATLATVRTGAPRTVVVSGEAGIGKSRLVQEFLAGLPTDVLVAQASCHGWLRPATPLGPVRRLLLRLADLLGPSKLLAAAGTGASTVSNLLQPADLPPVASAASQLSDIKQSLTDGIEQLLRSLSRSRPLVLVLHDIHLADESTLAVARSLVGTLDGCQLLLVLTRRSQDGPVERQLRALLAEIDLAHGVTRIELEPLVRAEVRELADQVLPRPLTEEDFERLLKRSEGVPLFVEELAAQAPGELPRSLQEMVMARCARLSPDARTLVECLAVAVPSLTHRLVADVAALRVVQVDAAIAEVLDSDLVRTHGDSYHFRHWLHQETIYEALSPPVRNFWHAAFARALLAQSDALAPVAARHWVASGDLAPAVATSLLAAQQGRSSYAFDSAAQFGEYVDQHWDELPEPIETCGLARWELRAQIAADWARAGEVEAAMRQLLAAQAVLPEGHVREWARLALDLRRLELRVGSLDSLSDLSAAHRPLADGSELEDVALAAAQLGVDAAGALLKSADLTVANRLAEEAAQLAVRLPDGDIPIEVAAVRSLIAIERGDLDAAQAVLAPHGDGAAGSVQGRLRLLSALLAARGWGGDFAGALAAADRGIALAMASGRSQRWEPVFRSGRVAVMVQAGDWPAAAAEIEAGLAQDPSPGSRGVLLLLRYELLVRGGELDAAAALLDTEAPLLHPLWAADPTGRWHWRIARSEAALTADDATAALHLLEPGWELTGLGRHRRDAEFALLAARALARLRPAPTTASERLGALLDALPADGYPGAVAAAARAELARPGEAWSAWSAVASALVEFPGAPAKLRWYVQARTAIAGGDRAGLARVRRAAETAGYRSLLGPIDAGFRPGKPADDPLTAREREVLDLVARGWSNRQIADQLRISPKTVSVHVSAILAKLGAATRTEAALHARPASSPVPGMGLVS